ncbi:hypothetical protein GE118_02095 [Mycoplasma sp. NEAQ87857]|uniref:ABC transporter permease n=1 Tax=Mycoplasma sp. NEAQ87857 TaxID=2683967 RepID=UPI001316DED5|nr:ABC transporter permease [Mycoplasma sp. NEAQ87857]QGZ97586.1 hypothetical protein GE118_02095 [Mycoplasma sp. NEAQ87857]
MSKYLKLLFSLIARKKLNYFIWTINLIFVLSYSLSFKYVNHDFDYNTLFLILITFEIFITILYSSLIALYLFKGLSYEGIDLLVFSKPISRKKIILAKLITLMIVASLWSLFSLILNIIALALFKLFDQILLISFISLISFFMAFMFFGNISAILSYKLSSKLALSINLLTSISLVAAGVSVNINTTSTVNHFAKFLNQKYNYNRSGNVANIESFFVKNQNKLYLVPNGVDNNEFSNKQKEFIDFAYNNSKQAPQTMHIYNFLSLPYQFIDSFNVKNSNFIKQENNLTNYLYQPRDLSLRYSYKINKNNPSLIKTIDSNKLSIVPFLLKNNSTIANLLDSKIIYARENANNFIQEFPEDKFVFASSDNLIGEIDWTIVNQTLANDFFDEYANKLFNKINQEINKRKIYDQELIKQLILKTITTILNNKDDQINTYSDPSTAVFDQNAIKNKIIQTYTQRQIYLFASLIYYLYFNNNYPILLDAILFNPNKMDYSPMAFNIKIGQYNYQIGGYQSYTPIQEVDKKTNKVVTRYSIKPKDNYLFTTTKDLYSVASDKQVTNIGYYFIIWIIVLSILSTISYQLYYKKDYK